MFTIAKYKDLNKSEIIQDRMGMTISSILNRQRPLCLPSACCSIQHGTLTFVAGTDGCATGPRTCYPEDWENTMHDFPCPLTAHEIAGLIAVTSCAISMSTQIVVNASILAKIYQEGEAPDQKTTVHNVVATCINCILPAAGFFTAASMLTTHTFIFVACVLGGCIFTKERVADGSASHAAVGVEEDELA